MTMPPETVDSVSAVRKSPPRQSGPKQAKSRGTAGEAPSAVDSASSADLVVRADETPWADEEIAEVRADLNRYLKRLRREVTEAEGQLAELMRDGGDGAGHDQADIGSTTFERDHEMAVARNASEMLLQIERALARIDEGTYGVCERCATPIGKQRLMAFPRATLCLKCKQQEERR